MEQFIKDIKGAHGTAYKKGVKIADISRWNINVYAINDHVTYYGSFEAQWAGSKFGTYNLELIEFGGSKYIVKGLVKQQREGTCSIDIKNEWK